MIPYARVISVLCTNPSEDSATGPDNHKHPKWITRRKYAEDVLIPSVRKLNVSDVSIFNAITPDDYTEEGRSLTWCEHRFQFTEGAWKACFLSHYTLWQECVKTNRTILILEDDARLDPSNTEKISNSIDAYVNGKHDGDILYLQTALPDQPNAIRRYDKHDTISLSTLLCRLRAPHGMPGTAAYVIQPNAAKKLIQHAMSGSLMCSVDGFITNSFRDGIIGVVVMQDNASGFMLHEHWYKKEDFYPDGK